jgi:plasmid rolling circle replication initiator protein Rep
MALTKEFEYDCEVRGVHKNVQVRKATIIKDGDEEISRSYHRHILYCRTKTDGTWGDTDISGEDSTVQAVCNAVWTDAVKTAYETAVDAQTNP